MNVWLGKIDKLSLRKVKPDLFVLTFRLRDDTADVYFSSLDDVQKLWKAFGVSVEALECTDSIEVAVPHDA